MKQDDLNMLCEQVAISAKHMRWLLDAIERHIPRATVWAFGSRVTGEHRPTSDLDMAVHCDKETAFKDLPKLNETLIESDLPFKVQLLDYNRLPENMQATIKKQYVVLYQPQKKDWSKSEQLKQDSTSNSESNKCVLLIGIVWVLLLIQGFALYSNIDEMFGIGFSNLSFHIPANLGYLFGTFIGSNVFSIPAFILSLMVWLRMKNNSGRTLSVISFLIAIFMFFSVVATDIAYY